MIRKAKKIDITKIMEIITATIREMKLYNNTQWDETYPQAINFSEDIEAGDLYVDELNNEIRGFVCVNYVEPLNITVSIGNLWKKLWLFIEWQ